jgi:hypothetical protein
VELALAVGVLGLVGAMTALNPARSELAQRTAEAVAAAQAALAPAPQPFAELQMADDLHVQLTISPGWVGENTFTVHLATMDGAPVSDASLIRLRFTHQTQDLGESELRITPGENQGENGVYTVGGANLSAPGAWQVRLTMQRPEQYDTVVDFLPTVEAPPAPPPLPPAPVAGAEPLPYRTAVMLVSGLLLVGAGGAGLARARQRAPGWRVWQGSGVVAGVLIALGAVLLVSTL